VDETPGDIGPRVICSCGPDNIGRRRSNYGGAPPDRGETTQINIVEAYASISKATAIMTTMRD
jgi:hypothetical protein